MKTSKISTIALWVCMLISIGIFAVFYVQTVREDNNQLSIGVLLCWIYFLLFISLATALCLSIVNLFLQGKNRSKIIRKPLIYTGFIAVLLVITYLFGKAAPLKIAGYDGGENTAFWLKMTDMWLYSLYALIVLVLLALLIGIAGSYIKNRKI